MQMKKLTGITLLLISSLLLGCTKSDDTKGVDPVFSLTYTPLKNLEELTQTHYYYAGFKAGEAKSSMLSSYSKSCNREDYLQLNFDANQEFVMNFFRMRIQCLGFEIVNLEKNILIKEGILRTKVSGSKDVLEKLIVDKEGRIELEIGFQGDYLRIEDRMSNYSRHKYDQKVYLYFKKRDI